MPRKSRKQEEKQGIFRMGEDAQTLMLTGRLTLKDSRAFVDIERPELVVLVPKQRVHASGWIQMEPDFSAIAYMARGDRTRCLDIEAESLLTLIPASLNKKIQRHHHYHNNDNDNYDHTEGQTVQVEHIILDPSGRRAELLLVPVIIST